METTKGCRLSNILETETTNLETTGRKLTKKMLIYTPINKKNGNEFKEKDQKKKTMFNMLNCNNSFIKLIYC